MKRTLLTCLFILTAGAMAFAGDVAAFVDIGLSSDGATYIFGEYGKTDVSFQGYAEIYAVDIAKNDFINVYRTKPSADTSNKTGRSVYDALLKKAGWGIRKYKASPAQTEQVLYVRGNDNSDGKEIVFKDYEGSSVEQAVFYHINLKKTVDGYGQNCKSSFFITLEKKDENGSVISRNTVGNPQIKRPGITDYAIDRIFSDSTGRNLVFVIKKTQEDSTGTSTRYMVETIRL